jgi:hypothetical protein
MMMEIKIDSWQLEKWLMSIIPKNVVAGYELSSIESHYDKSLTFRFMEKEEEEKGE